VVKVVVKVLVVGTQLSSMMVLVVLGKGPLCLIVLWLGHEMKPDIAGKDDEPPHGRRRQNDKPCSILNVLLVVPLDLFLLTPQCGEGNDDGDEGVGHIIIE